MTATSGMENAVGSGKVSTRDDRLHRGRKVTSGKCYSTRQLSTLKGLPN